ncbi:MAG: Ku protein [Nitrososphaeraceae archaeon]|nr:Ku protein [Nitrososphaeraceae archaeon]MBV9666577.1 Ku protein [Nitrososphaeraceae archaeon]
MPAHSIWKGSISFGLVNIPVKLYSTSDNSKDFSFNQLDNKNHKIQYKKWCSIEDREVPYSELKKGYQISKDNYVVIEKEDLDKIKMKTTQSIDVKEFIDSKDLDPLLIEKSYYVGPEKNKKNGTIDKAYTLFSRVINETNKIAIGKVVLKDREHLVALRAYQRGIVMHQLRYIDELKPVDEVEGMDGSSSYSSSQQPSIDSKELSLGKTLVENLSNKEFDISQYSDEYTKQLEKVINAKATGKETVSNTLSKNQDEDVSKNLLEALKASLQQKTTKPKRN